METQRTLSKLKLARQRLLDGSPNGERGLLSGSTMF